MTAAGGKGIAVACDHADDDQVRSLFDRIKADQGGLDLLVNNATLLDAGGAKQAPFWEKPLGVADLINVGLRSSSIASALAVPLMLGHGGGMIAGVSFYGAVSYFHNPAYGAGKAGMDKMAYDMSFDLRKEDIASVSIWPGFVATEYARTLMQERPDHDQILSTLETPQFTGLAIKAIFEDPNRMDLTGQTFIAAEVAQTYGYRDVNGKQPVSHRSDWGEPRPFQGEITAG